MVDLEIITLVHTTLDLRSGGSESQVDLNLQNQLDRSIIKFEFLEYGCNLIVKFYKILMVSFKIPLEIVMIILDHIILYPTKTNEV